MGLRIIPVLFASLCMAATPFSVHTVLTKSGAAPAGSVIVPGLKTGMVYSFLLDVDAGAKVKLVQASGTIAGGGRSGARRWSATRPRRGGSPPCGAWGTGTRQGGDP